MGSEAITSEPPSEELPSSTIETEVSPEETTSVTESVSEAFTVFDETEEDNRSGTPIFTAESDAALPMYADGLVEDAESTVLQEETSQDEGPLVTPDVSTSESVIAEGSQYEISFVEHTSEREITDEDRGTIVRIPQSRPSVSGGGHAFDGVRHSMDDLLRDIADLPVERTETSGQYIMQLDAVAPDMPVPDEDSVLAVVDTDEGVDYDAFTSVTDETDTQTSNTPVGEDNIEVIDIPAETKAPIVTTAEPIEEERVFHATVRAKRKTHADIDFDTTCGGILREKVFEETADGAGGEHAKEQIEKWQAALLRRRRSTRARSIIVGILVALLALFELIRPMTDGILGILLIARVPNVTALIDIQLLILVCLIGYRPLYRGIAALRFRRVIPETLAAFAAGVSLLGGVIFYLAGVNDQYLFALVGAVTVFAAVLADYFRSETLVHTFRAYTSEDTLYGGILTRTSEHRLICDLYRDGTDPLLMETEQISCVDGFVSAARERIVDRYAPFVSLCVAGGAALTDLIVLLIIGRGPAFSFWSAIVTFAALMPLTLFAVHRYLARMLTSRVAMERIGVTGEQAVYRYASCGVMSFSDTEAFPNGSVQVKGIKLCGEFRLDKALYLVSSLFDRVGGPLNSVFRISTADVRISDDVIIRKLASEGIEAQINHEDVCVGTRAYLERVGVEIFRDIEDEKAEQEGCRVLYVAYRGMLCTKFYVKYEINPAFEKNVEYYAKHGVSSVIITADPLMNDALLDSISYISDYDVRFLKQDLAALMEEKNVPREVEMLSYGPRKTLRRMPFFFKKYVALQRVASVAGMVGLGVCALAVPLLLGLVPIKTALFAFLFQLLALAPTAIIGVVVRRMNPNP